MDRFLLYYKENETDYKTAYEYFSCFKNFKGFALKHFLTGSYVDGNQEIYEFSKKCLENIF